MGLGIPELVILLIIVVVGGLALAWPASRICKRAGFSPWFGVLILVPLANVLLLWFVAFTPWPAMPDSGQGSHV